MQENERTHTVEGVSEICPNCGGSEFSTGQRKQKFLYGKEGEATEISAVVPVHACRTCGFEFTGEEAEEARHEAICRHLRLMTPKQIKAIREKYEVTRAEFARLSRIGTASLSRWEAGILIQNGANDQLLYLLQFEENVVLLNQREQSWTAGVADPADLSRRGAELAPDMTDQGRGIGRLCRPRKCPLRGRFRLLERPDECRAAAAGWSP